jgi:glycosyltransferase involved in cell wall biosynthesis
MSKIKIAHVITRLDRGGAPQVVEDIFNGLDRNIFECKLIYGNTLNPSEASQKLINSSRDLICVNSLIREINLLNDFAAFIELFSIFKKERFDIVHTHTAKAGFLGRLAAKLAGVRIIVHQPHGHNFYGYFNPLLSWVAVCLEKALALITDRIIVFTKLEREDFVNHGICAANKIAVVHSGIDLLKFKLSNNKKESKLALGIDSEDFVVGVISRLDEIKGVEFFVKAAKQVCEKIKNVTFVIVGDGSLREELEEAVKTTDLIENVIFLGWKEDIISVLQALDLCVLTSLNESVGRALLEAQSMGIPVVATRVGGIPEVVLENKTGILVRPKDSVALKEAIIELLENSQKRVAFSMAAKEFVGDKFSKENMLKEILSVYKDIL